MRNDNTAGERQGDTAAAKKPWTTPALDIFQASSAENQPFNPNRGDSVTSCGS
jgi:hypothetical protein